MGGNRLSVVFASRRREAKLQIERKLQSIENVGQSTISEEFLNLKNARIDG